MISLLSACFTQAPQESKNSSTDIGVKIIKEQGISEGLKYFKEQAVTRDDATSLFYLGWGFYRDGNNKDAQEIARFILSNTQEGNNLSGNCYYLLGQISSVQGEIDNAYAAFDKAVRIFRGNESKQGEFKTLCLLASLSIKSKAFGQGEDFLKTAKGVLDSSVDGESWGMGYFWELQSRIFFGLGFFHGALEASIESKKEYEKAGDMVRANHTLSGIAFFQMLTGQVEEGVANTKKVEDLIYETEDDYKVLSYYNGVNWILAHKCAGRPFKKLENELREYIRKKNDFLLLEHLKFVLNWQCQ